MGCRVSTTFWLKARLPSHLFYYGSVHITGIRVAKFDKASALLSGYSTRHHAPFHFFPSTRLPVLAHIGAPQGCLQDKRVNATMRDNCDERMRAST